MDPFIIIVIGIAAVLAIVFAASSQKTSQSRELPKAVAPTSTHRRPQSVNVKGRNTANMRLPITSDDGKWFIVEFPSTRPEKELVIMPDCGDFNIVGVTVDRQNWAEFIEKAQSTPMDVHLTREPDNPHDPNAIFVSAYSLYSGKTIDLGYIPRGTAAFVAKNYSTDMPRQAELLKAGYLLDEPTSMFISLNMLAPKAKARRQFEL